MCFKEKLGFEPERKSGPEDLIENNIKIHHSSTKVKTRGNYKTKSGYARGLVVHYTAGHYSYEDSAERTLRSLARRGLGCLVMDRSGRIWKSEAQDWNQVAYHAGSSHWLGKSGISRYCLGMEICNAGKLRHHNGQYYPWWAFRKKMFVRGSKPIPTIEVRIVKNHDNVKVGAYHKYSPAQEKALVDFINMQLDINPEFSLAWVVGHDEISPKRKSDPGGSLSMSMLQLRSILKI